MRDCRKAQDVKKLWYCEEQVNNVSSTCKRNKNQHAEGDTELLCKVVM